MKEFKQAGGKNTFLKNYGTKFQRQQNISQNLNINHFTGNKEQEENPKPRDEYIGSFYLTNNLIYPTILQTHAVSE